MRNLTPIQRFMKLTAKPTGRAVAEMLKTVCRNGHPYDLQNTTLSVAVGVCAANVEGFGIKPALIECRLLSASHRPRKEAKNDPWYESGLTPCVP